MVRRADQDRIKALLTEAITVLCKNGLGYEYNCGIQGLLGITLDDEDVFLVDIKETIVKATRPEPEEESNKEQTSTEPASPTQAGSPSSSSRRRRRRTSDSDGASAAKRAAMDDSQQGSDDVIVIKEELSENEVSQMYDTGGGNDQMPQDDSYGMALQDSGDYGGAGCSQWDTSSSSSQHAWPQQQMQQYDATQQPSSSSSALMSSTQILNYDGYEWEGTTPKVTLSSSAVRNTLCEALVKPTLFRQLTVSAVRLSWFANTAMELQPFYENLTTFRAELDNRIRTVPGILYFVSCLTATMSGKKKKLSFPGVSFWIVSDQAVTFMNLTNALGDKLGATMKLLIQPYQATAEHAEQVLYTVAKDCLDGVVKRVLDRLAVSRGLGEPFAITKLHTQRKERGWLEEVAQSLRSIKVRVDVEEF